MNATSKGAQRWRACKAARPAWGGVDVLRQACDGFVELRREATGGHSASFIAAFASIGCHTVFILIQTANGGAGRKGTTKEARNRSMESRKCQHLIRLARQFKRPVLVCVVDPPMSFKSRRAVPRRVFEPTLPLMFQWTLDVPVILLVSATKVSCGIFGMWLADRSVSFAHTKFVLEQQKPAGHHGSEIEAKQLVGHKILDGTIAMPPCTTMTQAKTASHKLRHLLTGLLDEVIKLTPGELKTLRQERLTRLESLITQS